MLEASEDLLIRKENRNIRLQFPGAELTVVPSASQTLVKNTSQARSKRRAGRRAVSGRPGSLQASALLPLWAARAAWELGGFGSPRPGLRRNGLGEGLFDSAACTLHALGRMQ